MIEFWQTIDVNRGRARSNLIWWRSAFCISVGVLRGYYCSSVFQYGFTLPKPKTSSNRTSKEKRQSRKVSQTFAACACRGLESRLKRTFAGWCSWSTQIWGPSLQVFWFIRWISQLRNKKFGFALVEIFFSLQQRGAESTIAASCRLSTKPALLHHRRM